MILTDIQQAQTDTTVTIKRQKIARLRCLVIDTDVEEVCLKEDERPTAPSTPTDESYKGEAHLFRS